MNEGRKLRRHYVDKKGRKRKEGTKENRIPLPPSLSLPLALSCFLPRDCEAAHLNGQLIHGGNGLLAPAVRRKTGEEGNGTFFRHGSQIKHLLARARERASPPPPSLFCFASLSLRLAAGVTIFATVVVAVVFVVVVSLP